MVENTPLLNAYKQKFVKRRLVQTCLGGCYFGTHNLVPWYVVALEFLVWLYPWIVGGIFTLVKELGNVETLHAAIGTGLVMLVTVFSAQLLSYMAFHYHESTDQSSIHNLTIQSQGSSKELRRLLAEEDALMFDSCCSFQVFMYIFAPKRILSGLFSAVAFAFVLPSTLMILYNSTAITIVLYIVSCIVVCMAQYSLTVGKRVPETSTYRSVDSYELEYLSRSFHVFLILIPYIVYIFNPTSIELILLNQILHWVLLSFPLLWLFGILPPIECFLIWGIEQVMIFCFGGSACSSDARLCFNILFSIGAFVGSAFISDLVLIITLNAAVGYILSTNLFLLIKIGFDKLSSIWTGTNVQRIDDFEITDSKNQNSSTRSKIYQFSWHLIHMALAITVAAVLVTYINTTSPSQEFKSGLEYTFIAIGVTSKLLREFQTVSIFGMFRNYLYPDCNYNKDLFFKRKIVLSVLSGINIILSKTVSPLLCVAYFALFTNSVSLPSWLVALGLVHAYRHFWQRSGNAILNLAIISVINISFRAQNLNNWWTISEPGTQLLIIDVCRDRLLKLIENLWFIFAITIKSQSDNKQKRPHGKILFAWNIITLPITIAICSICAALSSPVVSLFTLPLFLIGFPRPARFWYNQPGKAKASVCADSVYYNKLTASAIDMFEHLSSSAAFSNHVSFSSAPQYYLARSQDKTMWIQMVEDGCGYSYFTVKGFELQETSCHALEATKLEDMFTKAFETDDKKPSLFSPMSNLLSSVTPLDTVFITSYSDAKNSLIGIFDQKDSVKKVRSYFTKSLIWLLLKNNSKQTLKKQVFVNETTIPGQSVENIRQNETQNMQINVEMSNISRQESARSHKLSMRSTSLDSFTSILSTDNETYDKKPKQPSQKQQVNTVVGGFHNPHVVGNGWDDVDSLFSDSGFGLPSQDFNMKNKIQADLNGGLQGVSSVILPIEWMEIPLAKSDLSTDIKIKPSAEWLKHCVEKWCVNKNVESITDEMCTIALVCDSIFNKQGIPGKQVDLLTAQHLTKVFGGDVPWSPSYDWLVLRALLYKSAMKAFRYAVKLVYDEVSLGEIESDSEFDEYLSEYESDWFIGCETDPEWQSSIADEVKQLFSVDFDSKGNMSARVLSRQLVSLHIASVNTAAVHGIWANLSFELIYATNDDEERYSIQAHKSLIRNLTIQAADPPLGYPIFISSPMLVNTNILKS